MTMVNRQLLLSTRPQGLVEDSTVKLDEHDVPELADGQVLVQVELISIGPATRPWMDEAEGGYLPPHGSQQRRSPPQPRQHARTRQLDGRAAVRRPSRELSR